MSGYLLRMVVVVVCVLLRGSVQPTTEEVCPDACECTSRYEEIASRRAKAVTCAGSGGSHWPVNLAASVEVLRYTNNSLRKVDFFALRRVPSLLALELSHNGIHEIVGSGRTVPRLRHLDLSFNNLHIIQPHAFRDFFDLMYLNLSWNGLHTLSPGALVLPALRELDLTHNRLAVLRPHYFAETPRLEVLRLAHNVLASVPALVFSRSLQLLQLAHNRIVRLDEAAFEGINISGTLDLSGNALRRSPSSALKRLGRVDTLLLDDNQMRAVPSGAIVGIAARVLSVSRQKHLRFIQRGAFLNLPELEELILRENTALAYFPPGALALVPRLRELDFSGTALLALEKDILVGLPPIQRMHVANTSFICHCSLAWLHNNHIVVASSASPFSSNPAVRCLQQESGKEVELSEILELPSSCSPIVLPLFPETASVELGANISFQCRALASPPAKITWVSAEGITLGNNACSGRLCVGDHALTVRFLHRSDKGQYTCVAKNSLGATSRSLVLQVRDPNVKLFPLTVASTFVTLAWNMSGLAAHSYVLRWTSADERPARSAPFSAGPRAHSYTVHGLQPGIQYSFSLRMERDEDSIELCSTVLTTQPHGYLLSLGIERNYLGAIVLSALVGGILVGCVLYCGVRCCRRPQEFFATPERTTTLRKAELFQSTSAHSDVAFITFIDLPEDSGTPVDLDLTESNLNLA